MCSVCGYITTNTEAIPKAKEIMLRLLVEGEIRGSDASGISFVDKSHRRDTLFCLKEPLPAHEFVELKELKNVLKTVNPTIMIGHTRAKTQGDPKDNNNNHPVMDEHGLALVHNGTISNDDAIAKKYKLHRIGEVDSEVIVQTISYWKNTKGKDTIKAIQKTAHVLYGAMTCAMIDKHEKNALYVWASTNPLILTLHKPTGTVYFASTKDIMEHATEETRRYMAIFTETYNSADYVHKLVNDNTGYKIVDGVFTEFALSRPSWKSQYPQSSYGYGNSYTEKSNTWVNKNGETWCMVCNKYHTTQKPYKCGFLPYSAIVTPSKYSTDQLAERLMIVYKLIDDESTSEAIALTLSKELKRIEDALTYREDASRDTAIVPTQKELKEAQDFCN